MAEMATQKISKKRRPFEVKVDDTTLLGWVLNDIQYAEMYYAQYIQMQTIKRFQRYTAQKDSYYRQLFPNLTDRCQFVLTDVADTIDWILPSLMRIFWGGNEIITINGRTPDDNPDTMRDLTHWQLQCKNPGFLIFYRWFQEALWAGYSWVKIRWIREFERRDEICRVGVDEFMQMTQEAEQPNAQFKIKKAEMEANGIVKVTIRRRYLKENFNSIENVPISEMIWNPYGDNPSDIPFIDHRRQMYVSDVRERQRAGYYTNLDEEDFAHAMPPRASLDSLDNAIRPFIEAQRSGAASGDTSRNRVRVDECYGKWDINLDGILEDCVITRIGNKIVRVEENTYGRPPFCVLSPYPDNYTLMGRSIDDMIGDIQDMKVAFLRQMILNVANNNDRQVFVDEDRINGDDLRDNRRYIRVTNKAGDRRSVSEAIQFFPENPLSPLALQFMEYLDSIKEQKTGITRYSTGTDANTLNKTATGVSLIQQGANQRIEMIARMFAETGVKDLFRSMVEFNQRFIDQDQVIRLTNKYLTVKADDLQGDYDYEIAGGIGVSNKQSSIVNMQTLLSMYPQMIQLGIADKVNVYNAFKKMIEEMGYKNVEDFAKDPQAQNQMQGMLNQMQSQPGGQIPPTQETMNQNNPDLMSQILGGLQQPSAGEMPGMTRRESNTTNMVPTV